MISRRNLTTLLLVTIEAKTNKPVLDAHSLGSNFGWSGTPGEAGSSFNPYTVLMPGQSPAPTGPLGDTQADWRLNYTLSSFGSKRMQTEWIADLARSSLYPLRKTNFDGVDGTYRIQQVRTESLGGIIRSEAIEPPIFGQTDSFSVWVTKEL